MDNETHCEIILRILFIYSKLNPGIKYVQGMNEILAPLYYCFANDPHPEFNQHAEADSFYCFCKIMGDLKDNFIESMDKTSLGIKANLKLLDNTLKRVDN